MLDVVRFLRVPFVAEHDLPALSQDHGVDDAMGHLGPQSYKRRFHQSLGFTYVDILCFKFLGDRLRQRPERELARC